MTDVFISYARADRDRVRLIAHGLAAEGFAVWWDPEIKPGKKWNEVIRRALDGAAAVVTCWSPASVKSTWVIAETTAAQNRQVLVPAQLKPATPPIPFNMIQAADLTRWRGDGDDPQWRALLAEVRRLVEARRRFAAAVPPPGQAHGAHRPSPFLGAAAPEEVGRYRPGTRRAGPGWLKAAAGGLAVTAALTVLLWGGASYFEGQSAPDAPPRATAPPAPPTQIAAPAPNPAPAPSAPATAPLSDVTPPPTPPPAPTPTPAPAPPPVSPPAVDASAAVDDCLNRIARVCVPEGRTDRRMIPMGFSDDGRLSIPERNFAATLGIRAPTTPAALSQCEAQISSRTFSTRLREVCPTIRPTPTPTQTPPTPQRPQRPQGSTAEAAPPAIDWGAIVRGIAEARREQAEEQARRPPQQQPTPSAPAAQQPSAPPLTRAETAKDYGVAVGTPSTPVPVR